MSIAPQPARVLLALEPAAHLGQVQLLETNACSSSVEMTSPAFLVRAGWKSSTLKPGDKVSITLRPFRNGDPGGLFVSVTLADGRVLGERAAPPPVQP